ncbi:hypothetical protein [Streptomyces sp. NPDC056921]|uniref:hypothetical protein n=1 Tax=Streptomyces sp. NPDC056921 TaxID=3345966 RepID=UPI003627C157
MITDGPVIGGTADEEPKAAPVRRPVAVPAQAIDEPARAAAVDSLSSGYGRPGRSGSGEERLPLAGT